MCGFSKVDRHLDEFQVIQMQLLADDGASAFQHLAEG
jgi:hypothetical protein